MSEPVGEATEPCSRTMRGSADKENREPERTSRQCWVNARIGITVTKNTVAP